MYRNSICIEVEPDIQIEEFEHSKLDITVKEEPGLTSTSMAHCPGGEEDHDPLSLEMPPPYSSTMPQPRVASETLDIAGSKTENLNREQPLLMECEVKLEPTTDNEPDKSQNMISFKPCFSTEVKIEIDIGNIKCEKEDAYDCDICSRRFAQQSELWDHAMVCLPTSLRVEETGEKEKPENKLRRSPPRKSAVRKCSAKPGRAAPNPAPPETRQRNATHAKESKTIKKRAKRICSAKYIILDSGEKLYTCETCPKNFKTIKNLNIHKKTHTGEKPFKCDVCEHAFTRLGNLKMHLLIHSGEKRFTCNVCDKKFTQLGNLKTHERIHSGTKPYSCDICQKNFTALSHLIAHKKVHTELRPYVCDICDKRYKRSDYLKEHKLTHSQEAYRYSA